MDKITSVLQEKRLTTGRVFSSPELYAPSGFAAPDTAKSKLSKMMLDAGLITPEEREKMLGVSYDYDDDNISFTDVDDDDDVDDFILSKLSEYEDFSEVSVVENNTETESEKFNPSSPPKDEGLEEKSEDEPATE